MAHRERLAFAWFVDPALHESVVGDTMRISQVITNLLTNAFKCTEQGQVRLVVKMVASSQDTVEVRFEVQDSGIGIPEDRLDNLFQSFTQVDTSSTRKYGGAGLGLAICQELVKLMGGSMSVQSRPGAGSTFSFTLPLRVDTA